VRRAGRLAGKGWKGEISERCGFAADRSGKLETIFITTQSFVLKKNVSYCDSIVAGIAC